MAAPAQTCELEGVSKSDWAAPSGVTEVSGGVDLQFVTQGARCMNVGSRMYVLEGEEYKQFKLLGKQISFDVDAFHLPCGTNGAVYFVEMPADASRKEEPRKRIRHTSKILWEHASRRQAMRFCIQTSFELRRSKPLRRP